MPKIQWSGLPEALRKHLLLRLKERQVTGEDLLKLMAWRQSEPDAPDGPSYKDFGSFKVCGEGQFPKSLLKGQAAKGRASPFVRVTREASSSTSMAPPRRTQVWTSQGPRLTRRNGIAEPAPANGRGPATQVPQVFARRHDVNSELTHDGPNGCSLSHRPPAIIGGARQVAAAPGEPAMRKVILFVQVSLDGFFEGPKKEIDWHMVDDEFHAHINEVLKVAGGFLSGRVTYELMAGFWPTADADPASTPPVKEFARIWRDMPKVVYSRTRTSAGWNTTIAREVVREEVEQLKARARGDLVVGGGDLAAAFMGQDLIDEYRIYVHPIQIGEGKRLFPPSKEKVLLRFAETRTFGNGVVLLRYERLRPGVGS